MIHPWGHSLLPAGSETSDIPIQPGKTGLTTILLAFSVCLSLLASPVRAQDVDPEWPCIQRLVPVISPAIMWPVPVEDEQMTAWKADDEVRPLARRLGDLAAFTDSERAAIEQFAAAQDASRLEERLTLLAAGVVDTTNDIRQRYIEGIKRYTRQQIAISRQIQDSLNQLSILGDRDDQQAREEQRTIKETLHWHERVYDQRESAIQSLCEEPVELEELLSEVLREATYYLP